MTGVSPEQSSRRYSLEQDTSSEPEGAPNSPDDNVLAFLENLTVPSRGKITWLVSDQASVCVGAYRVLRIVPETIKADKTGAHARLNAAILPEFGGANIGFPVLAVHRLLEMIVSD